MRPWLRPSLAGVAGALPWFGRRPWQHRHDAPGARDPVHWRSRFIDRAASRLQLDAAQRALLGELFDRLQAQKLALRGAGDWRADLASLVHDGTFDRWHAHDLLNARLAAVREHGPQVIAALGEFYDALQPAQQQKLRELMQRWTAHRH